MSLIKVDPAKVVEKQKAEAQANRAAAYTAESDPIMAKWLRGEAEKEEWLAAVEAIRLRYPYPETDND